MKNETRKFISGLIATALMTSIFTGCSKNETSSDPFSSDTSIISDVITPVGETKLYRDETLDMRYKHWYDNPDVTAAQQAEHDKALAGTDTGEKYLNTFTIYTDSDGNRYYFNGRVPNRFDNKYEDVWEYRDPETGRLMFIEGVDDVSNDIAKISEDLNPSSDYEDYAGDSSLAEFADDVDYKVFLNNVDLGDTFNLADQVMPISDWLHTQHIAYFHNDNPPTLHIATAFGQDAITFETIADPDNDFDGGWLIKYKDGDFEQATAASEVVIDNDVLNLTPRAVETVLGLKILVNDEHKVINIITDNKDLVGEDSMFTNEPTSEPEPAPENPDEWTETPTSGIMYVVISDTPAREKPLPEAEIKNLYQLNGAVTVTAKTSTGFYKIKDGTYIHEEYLGSSKIQAAQPTTPEQPTTPTQPTEPTQPANPTTPTQPTGGSSSSPKQGDRKVENGVTYEYNAAFDMWAEVGTGNQGTPSAGTLAGKGEIIAY